MINDKRYDKWPSLLQTTVALKCKAPQQITKHNYKLRKHKDIDKTEDAGLSGKPETSLTFEIN